LTGRPGRRRLGPRLTALFLLGLVCFNPPLLRIFGAPVLVLGVPLITLYIFSAWAVVILLVALTTEGRNGPAGGSERSLDRLSGNPADTGRRGRERQA
jgi:hypothetical protein